MTAADGVGSWCPCRLRLRVGADPVLEPVGGVHREVPPTPCITVAVALPKGDRGDWAVQKLTEVGVDSIVPLLARRSVVRWTPERAERAGERLTRVVRAAAMQARRVWLPMLGEPVGVEELVALHDDRVAAAVPDGAPPSLAHPTVLVGPEGGWDDGELPEDLPRVGLGPTILRTETAATVVGSALAMLRHFRPPFHGE